MKLTILLIITLIAPFAIFAQPQIPEIEWEFYSTKNGDMEVPNSGNQQTSSLIVDVDNDGIQEIMITERTTAPGVVMYKMQNSKWERFIIDAGKVRVEAGATKWDIDSDGDMDIVFGGDGGSNQVWWWENPYPEFDKNVAWKRYLIKDGGKNKHHDQLFGDFDGDGKGELVFWNQSGNQLCIAEIPENVKAANEWDYHPIFKYSSDSQMEQIGQENYPRWKGVNEHEGLAKADIDGDGLEDIIGGGLWFKYLGEKEYQENLIDESYTFSRSAAGQLIEGGRPEVILVVGDGIAPMRLYEWKEGTWFGKTLIESVDNGHSLDLVDFNGDGHLDIFNGEMRLGTGNPDAKLRILLGDGKGNFTDYVVSTGYGNHESRIADLDGDGDYDILGKPYNWEAPRIDIWMQK